MATSRIVVIGASAGGIEALKTLAASLPEDFQAPVCIVMHTSPDSPGTLHDILGRAGVIPAVTASDGMRLRMGHIYVAPPDRHLVVEPGRIRVTRGPRENRFRPAIDPLFRSAAQVFGPAAIGVILTGNLDDGIAGLWAIKKLGGIAIVQDPDDALFSAMPNNALQSVAIDHRVPIADLGPLLTALVETEPAGPTSYATAPRQITSEVDIAKGANAIDAGVEEMSTPSRYACPECHGVLLELDEEGRMRFRCHTGHAYSSETLRVAIEEGIEASLWTAIRSLEEGHLLMRKLASERRNDDPSQAGGLVERAELLHEQARTLRRFVIHPVEMAPTKS